VVQGLESTRKVDVSIPGKGNSNTHGARPVHLIISMIKWIRTSELSIQNSLWIPASPAGWWLQWGGGSNGCSAIDSCRATDRAMDSPALTV